MFFSKIPKIPRKYFDLKNATDLHKYFNVTFEEVWMYSAMLQPHILENKSITPIIPCFSLNVPKFRPLKIGEYYFVSLQVYKR